MPGKLDLSLLVGAHLLVACSATPSTKPNAPPRPFTLEQDPLAIMPRVERRILPNGLTVFLSEDHRVPAVAVRVAYRVGAANDPRGRNSLAHLVEHLSFRGSRHVPPGSHQEYLLAAGAGEVNATTSLDTTEYWELVPASELVPTLWLESDRMASGLATLTDADIEHERRVVTEERGEAVETVTAGSVGNIVLDAVLPGEHPYAGRGGKPELDGLTLAEVHAFHDRYYVPSAAALVVAGDFDAARTWPVVEQYFGGLERKPEPARPATPGFVPTARTLEVETRITNPAVVLAWATPAEAEPDSAELDVWAEALSDRVRRLVAADLSDGAWVRRRSFALMGLFEIWIDVRRGVDPNAIPPAVARLFAELESDAQRTLVVHDMTRQRLVNEYGRADRLTERSALIADAQLLAGSPLFLADTVQRFRAVTPASFLAAGTKYLSLTRALTVLVSSRAGAPRTGRLRGP